MKMRYRASTVTDSVDTQEPAPSLKRKVAAGTLDRLKGVWSWCVDKALRIDTVTHAFSAKAIPPSSLLDRATGPIAFTHDDAGGYQAPDYINLRKIVKFLKPGPGDVVFDLGSGKSRALCVFARRDVQRCVGVEIFEFLCDTARENARRLRGRRAPIEIRCEDAASADVSEGTVYFMYNPFGAETMRDVIANIGQSLQDKPRDVTVVYYNTPQEAVLAESGWLELYHTMTTFSGTRISFWRHRARH